MSVHGLAMIQLRSHIGFLRRLRDNDDLHLGVRDACERPIRRAMRQLNISDESFDHALFLYNALFDPRDILDLVDSGLTEEEAVQRLVGAFCGALEGWAKNDAGKTPQRAPRSNRNKVGDSRAS
jgi:hypothetical protein